jgi:hypothetical protein
MKHNGSFPLPHHWHNISVSSIVKETENLFMSIESYDAIAIGKCLMTASKRVCGYCCYMVTTNPTWGFGPVASTAAFATVRLVVRRNCCCSCY